MSLTKIEAMVKMIYLDLLARGRTPTGRALLERIPGRNAEYLLDVRNRLVSLGQIPPLPTRTPREVPERRGGSKDGLLGHTDEEQAEIDARRLEVLREKRVAEVSELSVRLPRTYRNPFATARRSSSIKGGGG